MVNLENMSILKKNNCKKVLFAGKVNKPKFSKLKLDLKEFTTSQNNKKIETRGCCNFKEIINIFKKRYKNNKFNIFYTRA